MDHLATATASSPTPAEQSRSVVLDAETMVDSDTGRLTLIASTDPTQGDLAEVSPDRLHEMVAEARTKLDEIERLANEYEARETLRSILAEHDIVLEEWTRSSLTPELQGKLRAFYGEVHGTKIVIVPPGQGPIERLSAVVDVVHGLREQEPTA